MTAAVTPPTKDDGGSSIHVDTNGDQLLITASQVEGLHVSIAVDVAVDQREVHTALEDISREANHYRAVLPRHAADDSLYPLSGGRSVASPDGGER